MGIDNSLIGRAAAPEPRAGVVDTVIDFSLDRTVEERTEESRGGCPNQYVVVIGIDDGQVRPPIAAEVTGHDRARPRTHGIRDMGLERGPA